MSVEAAMSVDSLLGAVDKATRRAQEYFLRTQEPQGYWWAELESNPSITAEHLLLTHFLGIAEPAREQRIVNYLRERQRDDGTWAVYYGAPGDVSVTTEAYFALKLAGVQPDEPLMRKARLFVLSQGGVPRTRIFTKIWLALFDQWDWRGTPTLPPELILLPNWFYVNIYEFASWARATVVPMLVILTEHPVHRVPPNACIDELYVKPRAETDYRLPPAQSQLSWRNFFLKLDALLRWRERLPWKIARPLALKRIARWIEEHQEADGSWGGIQPPWVYSLIALKTLGYPLDHPVMAKGIAGFEGYKIEDKRSFRLQSCTSPVWDTALIVNALCDSGLAPDHPALHRAADWLLKEQVMTGGDWQVKNKRGQPGGWAFEYENDIYPDVDDTAEVAMALLKLHAPDELAKARALERALAWTLTMQSKNGGWGAFDVDNTRAVLTKIPFADFGETLDPPSADVTAHTIEWLGLLGQRGHDQPALMRALRYLYREQERDGSWFGRWGVNYVYGVGAVLPALAAAGEDMRSPAVRRAVEWLGAHQNADGGWGEGCDSYEDDAKRGIGPSTASQTAWALLALVSAGEAESPAARRGVQYLLRTQQPDGTWPEDYFTGTGFPRDFMIKYHGYRNYFPLWALGRFRSALSGQP